MRDLHHLHAHPPLRLWQLGQRRRLGQERGSAPPLPGRDGRQRRVSSSCCHGSPAPEQVAPGGCPTRPALPGGWSPWCCGRCTGICRGPPGGHSGPCLRMPHPSSPCTLRAPRPLCGLAWGQHILPYQPNTPSVHPSCVPAHGQGLDHSRWSALRNAGHRQSQATLASDFTDVATGRLPSRGAWGPCPVQESAAASRSGEDGRDSPALRAQHAGAILRRVRRLLWSQAHLVVPAGTAGGRPQPQPRKQPGGSWGRGTSLSLRTCDREGQALGGSPGQILCSGAQSPPRTASRDIHRHAGPPPARGCKLPPNSRSCSQEILTPRRNNGTNKIKIKKLIILCVCNLIKDAVKFYCFSR